MTTTQTLTDLIIKTACRPGGMITADLPTHPSTSVSSGCNRLAGEGRIFRARLAQRRVRFFGTQAEAADFLATVSAGPIPGPDAQHPWRPEKQQPIDKAPRVDMSRAKRTAGKAPMPAPALVRRLPSDLPFVPRVGSMEFEQHPSRFGNTLHYRDGRVESLVEGAAK